MHVERLFQLADILENAEIAKTELKARWKANEIYAAEGYEGEVAAAADFLGLGHNVAEELFYPSGNSDGRFADNKRAARVVRHLAVTGAVDWTIP